MASANKVFYRARKGDIVTKIYDKPGMARSMRTRNWGHWDYNQNKSVIPPDAVIEYVEAGDWKILPDGLQSPPTEAVETEDPTLKRGWVVSISDSWTNDPTMPLGHMIGTELYKALCEVYDQAQAIGEKPGKLIIESEKNDRYRCTDYHITLYTEKVE